MDFHPGFNAGLHDLLERKKKVQDELHELKIQHTKTLKSKSGMKAETIELTPELLALEEEMKDIEGKIIEKSQDQRSEQ